MRAWLGELRWLAWMEAVRLLRMEQAFRFLLVPVVVLLPLTFLVVSLFSSLRDFGTSVALPLDLPPELDLARPLESKGIQVVWTASPQEVWEEGRVDGAVLSCRPGEGIHEARSGELAWQELWRLEVAADDEDLESTLSGIARDAGQDLVVDQVVLAGGDPGRDLEVADTSVLDMEKRGLSLDIPRAARGALFLELLVVSMILLVLSVVADRREGVTEALMALPSSPVAWMWARMGVQVGVQAFCAVAVLAPVLLISGDLRNLVPGLELDLPAGASLVSALVLGNASQLAVGVVSANARQANNLSGLAMGAIVLLLVLGVWGPSLPWVPVAGAVCARGALEHGVATGVNLACAWALLQGCGALLRRRVALVLPGAEA